MSLLKRIALVIRSYAVSAGDKLESVAAEEELRRAGERAAPAQQKAESSPPAPVRTTKLEADYRYLGVKPGADLTAVESAWRALAARADPKRFPSGSDQERQAAQILSRLNESYYRIREELNPTEGRFGRLEL